MDRDHQVFQILSWTKTIWSNLSWGPLIPTPVYHTQIEDESYSRKRRDEMRRARRGYKSRKVKSWREEVSKNPWILFFEKQWRLGFCFPEICKRSLRARGSKEEKEDEMFLDTGVGEDNRRRWSEKTGVGIKKKSFVAWGHERGQMSWHSLVIHLEDGRRERHWRYGSEGRTAMFETMRPIGYELIGFQVGIQA